MNRRNSRVVGGQRKWVPKVQSAAAAVPDNYGDSVVRQESVYQQMKNLLSAEFTRALGDNREMYIKYSLEPSLTDLDGVRSNHPGVMRAVDECFKWLKEERLDDPELFIENGYMYLICAFC